MEPATALKLFEEGGLFIFLNLPEGTEFGIDMKSWNIGEKFRGVKMIPPGLHFIFYSSVNDFGETAPRTGFFHNFHSGEILIKKWDIKNECLSTEIAKDEEIVKFKDNLRAMDQFLGPYPFDIYEKWNNLTANITESIVKKLVPTCGEIRSALELESCSDADRPRGNKDVNKVGESSRIPKRRRLYENFENLPNLKPKPGTSIRLSEFPDRNYPENATAAEITKHSLDSTYLLEKFLENYETSNDILGELEFCFVCFLVGHSLEAFEQWKKIINLLCSCEDAIEKYWRMYNRFLTIIEFQVKEIPEEFLADIVSNNNFVYVKLKQLFRSIKSANVDGELKTKCQRLQKTFADIFMWDFTNLESEDEDEAPVIVELDN